MRSLLALAAALLCAGCMSWGEADFANDAAPRRPDWATPAGQVAVAPPAPRVAEAPALTRAALTLNDPGVEEFICQTRGRLRMRYSNRRANAVAQWDSGQHYAMRRADREGMLTYVSAGVAFHRNGPRASWSDGAEIVTVVDGDTLGAIAARAYGDRTRAAEIAAANNIANPDVIYPGQVLRLSGGSSRFIACRRVHAAP
ncbi:MAG: LysM peptidoglycan-binding domain-containing protein [Hyphomonadaceae bacterium]